MDETLLRRNLEALRLRNPSLVARLEKARPDGTYAESRRARSGHAVPVLSGGAAMHTLYDVDREAESLLSASATSGFALFAGIGSGVHIARFLSRDDGPRAVAVEAGVGPLVSLFSAVDLSAILGNPRLVLVAEPEAVFDAIVSSYLPALHGGFARVPLRPWCDRFPEAWAAVERGTRAAIEATAADVSTQAHFGALWFRNCLRNLGIASRYPGTLPDTHGKKTAAVLAAGPSLEEAIEGITRDRRDLYVVACDTAYPALVSSGIEPDMIVSIDAQGISRAHVARGVPQKSTVVLDVCGNPAFAEAAERAGANLVVAAGGHPLARFAAGFSPLPRLDTSSGTVAVAALDVVRSLGFRTVRIAGADFAYVGGKPYARGTYLSDLYDGASARTETAETQYAALTFRSPVERDIARNGRVTYRTAVLTAYRAAFDRFLSGAGLSTQAGNPAPRLDARPLWADADVRPFDFFGFLGFYARALEGIDARRPEDYPAFITLLPLAAARARETGTLDRGVEAAKLIRLALDVIAGYTKPHEE